MISFSLGKFQKIILKLQLFFQSWISNCSSGTYGIGFQENILIWRRSVYGNTNNLLIIFIINNDLVVDLG